jgi:nitrate/nitrite transport system ATP-binding protein
MISNNLEEALLLSDRIIPMTRGPRATLGLPVDVGLPKPRSVERLLHDEQAVRARGHVVARLTDQLHSASPGDAAAEAGGLSDTAPVNAATAEVRL